MALCSDSAMVLFYDIEGRTADHDDWHSHEHFHERLSVPGFLRATRWIATDAEPRYLVTYEVSGVEVATSQAYLDRLDNPSEWTGEMMPRFRGMMRGFCRIVAGAGFGLGAAAVAVRFMPREGEEDRLSGWLAGEIVPAMAGRRGMVGAHVLRPTAPPPMTREQSLRGADLPMPWLLIATAYDGAALARTAGEHLDPAAFRHNGASGRITRGAYALHQTATAAEAARTARPAVLGPEERMHAGPRG